MNQYSPQGFSILPPVVKNLIIVNTLFFLATWVLGGRFGVDLNSILGLHFFKGEDFAFYQYVSYMFMHGSLNHLFFNMFALWMFGYVLENTWGGKRFLIFYFITGIGAAITQTVVNGIDYYTTQAAINTYANAPSPDSFLQLMTSKFSEYYQLNRASIDSFVGNWTSMYGDKEYAVQSVLYAQEFLSAQANIPTVGASGAVYGILLAFGMLFPNQLIYIYFLFPIKAKWFVVLYGAIELFSGIYSSGSGIAHFAHLGGMLFGYFLIRYWRKNQFRRMDF